MTCQLCRYLYLAVAMVGSCIALVSRESDEQFPVSDPAEQGVSAEALEELAEVVRGYVENDSAVGGELLVIKNRKVVMHRFFGESDSESNTPWSEETICNIRSMTKMLTGAAAQILIDRGELELDAPVAKYLPGSFDNDKSRDITVRQVLTHRSGLPLTILTDPFEYEDLQSQVAAIGENGPEFEPDSKFWYSDAGTDVVGALVEKVSGQLLDEFIQAEFLDPLGMKDSFYGYDASDDRFRRIASLYVGSPKSWVRFWKADEKPFYPFAWGSQTLYSTPRDYAKFLAMLMDDGKAGDQQILSAAAVQRMLEPVSEMKVLGGDAKYPTEFHGLEAFYGQMALVYCPAGHPDEGLKLFGHSGSDGTAAWAFPEQDLMVFYFTQSRGGSSVIRLERDIDRLLINPSAYATDAEVPEKFRPYLGTFIANFANFEDEEFTVQMRDGNMALDIPSQMVFQLNEPNDEGKWSFAIAPNQIQVSFGKDEQGKVNVLRIHQAGRTFEVPRKGSALAEQIAKERAEEIAQRRVVSREEMKQLEATYRNEDEEVDVAIFADDDGLKAKFPPGITVNLHTTKDVDVWGVKQDSNIRLSFQRNEDGEVVSMTRIFRGNELVFVRQ